jgi:hypothetical protein
VPVFYSLIGTRREPVEAQDYESDLTPEVEAVQA